jgi:hypothetical protein
VTTVSDAVDGLHRSLKVATRVRIPLKVLHKRSQVGGPDVLLAQLEYPSAGSKTTSPPGWAECEERAGDAEARLGQPCAD